jgi:hypothetical protein
MTVSRRGQPWNMYPSHCSTHILSKARKVEVVEAKVNAQQEKAGVHHCSQTSLGCISTRLKKSGRPWGFLHREVASALTRLLARFAASSADLHGSFTEQLSCRFTSQQWGHLSSK